MTGVHEIIEITGEPITEPVETVQPIEVPRPTKPRRTPKQSRATQKRPFTPSKIKLARDWFHAGDRVVMLTGFNCGRAAITFAMTMACDLCQGKTPQVLFFTSLQNPWKKKNRFINLLTRKKTATPKWSGCNI